MKILLQPKKVALVLSGIICLLIAAHLAGLFAQHVLHLNAFSLKYFHLTSEQSLPTYFSTFQLLTASLLLLLIASLRKRRKCKDYEQWLGLAGLFLFLSLDEALMIHEMVALKVRETSLDTSGIFYFAWIVPYAILVMLVGLCYLPFVLKLPTTTRKLMLLSGIVFVGGALGLEAVESLYYSTKGETDLIYTIFTTLEESLEMFGILIFLYALLQYLDQELGGVSLQIQSVGNHNALSHPLGKAPAQNKEMPAESAGTILDLLTKP